MGNVIFILVIILVITIVIIIQQIKKHLRLQRLEYLKAKYQDPQIVDMIAKKMIWQGQTSEQLIDSIGKPVDIDTKVLKTKKKETWKYRPLGANRYGLKIFLENGVVIGWDEKD